MKKYTYLHLNGGIKYQKTFGCSKKNVKTKQIQNYFKYEMS